MNILTDVLVLEVTQLCNLTCKHCARGQSCPVFMSDEIIYNTFREVRIVNTLLLAGGEAFLAYEIIKRLLEIAKEMDTKIYQCQIITNGCIYDQRIYDLLDFYFGDNFSIAISVDKFHNDSIAEVYGNSKENSTNPALQPKTLEDVTANLVKLSKNPHLRYTKDVSNNLINVGRAKELTDVEKREYSILGYFYDTYNDNMLVGPAIFIDANGYIGDLDSEIEHRQEENLGQVGKDSIANSIIGGGVKKYFATLDDYYTFCKKRVEEHYHTNTCKCYRFENKKMVEIETKKTCKSLY